MREQEVSLAQLADALGVTVQRVEELAAEGVIEEIRPGRARFFESVHRFTEDAIKDAVAAARAEREVTIAHLADVLSLTVQRVNQLAAEGIIEKTRHGHARLGSSIRRYIDYCVERATIKGRSVRSTWGERVKTERARKLKLENDVRERILVSISDVATALDVIVGPLKADLAGVPARVTDDVILRRRIEDGIESVLRDLANRFRKASGAMREGSDPYSALEGEDG